MKTPLAAYALSRPQWVKDLIDPKLSGDDENLIIAMINGFSAAAQGMNLCNREFELKQREEYFDGNQNRFMVLAPPIIRGQDLVVWDDVDRDYLDADVLVIGDDYRVNYTTGLIKRVGTDNLLDWRSVDAFDSIKVQYQGGLVVNGEAVNEDAVVIPADLRSACEMQVSFWFRNKGNLGVSAMSLQGGATTMFQPTQLLPAVKQILLANRRFAI